MQRTREQRLGPGSPTGSAARGAERRARVLICVLASAAGCTDAVNYLAFGHVFTANMTGNTVLMGIAIIGGHGAQVLRSACALAGFCAGVALGARYLRRARPALWPRQATRTLALEALTLAILGGCGAYFGVGTGRTYGWIALSGLAMGMQSAAVCLIEVPGVATTYITGTLTHMIMGEVGRADTAGYASSNGRRRRGTSVVAASIWAVYLAAALAGAAAAMAIGVRAIWIAAAIVASVSALAALSARLTAQ